jgi:hypothetical protein
MNRDNIIFKLSFIIAIFLTGLIVLSCVRKAAPLNLVPYIDYSTFTSSGKSIKVGTVKAGQVNMPVEDLKITGEIFQKAISETLVKANIFEVVLGEKKVDYECHSEIISQKVIPGVTANAILFVNYWLIDTKTKDVVWNETVLSQYYTYGGDLTYAIEASARDNLSKFVTKLSLDLSFLKTQYVAKAQHTESDLLYFNPTYYWSISYPPNWIVDDKHPAFIRILSPKDNALCGIHCGSVRFSTVDELTDFILDYQEEMLKEKGLVSVILYRRHISLQNEKTGNDVLVHFQPGGMSRRIFVLFKGLGYGIDCETYAQNWKKVEPIFDRIISSFTLYE